MAKTKITYVLQTKFVRPKSQDSEWLDCPFLPEEVDIYAAIALKDTIGKFHADATDPLAIMVNELYAASSNKIDVRIVKRTATITDEVIEEPERILG